MRRRGVLSHRKWIVLAVVLGGHALLIVLFAIARQRDSLAAPDSQRRSALFLIHTPRSIDPPLAPAPIEPLSIDVSPPRLSEPVTPTTPLQIAPPARSPQINWRAESKRAARDSIEGIDAPRAPDATPRQFEWNPEPKRAGFSGLLPYVRIGKRCVIGLGFFGCAIGDLPEANGHLFDAMNDPDRPRSSVPDVEQ